MELRCLSRSVGDIHLRANRQFTRVDAQAIWAICCPCLGLAFLVCTHYEPSPVSTTHDLCSQISIFMRKLTFRPDGRFGRSVDQKEKGAMDAVNAHQCKGSSNDGNIV